jgi:2'-5' RNA ligase
VFLTARLLATDMFRNRVLYMKMGIPEQEQALAAMVKHLMADFEAAGIQLRGNRPTFTPHATLLKVRVLKCDCFELAHSHTLSTLSLPRSCRGRCAVQTCS